MHNKTLFFLLMVCAISVMSCKKEGCTDPASDNYDPDADKDDGSCEYATPSDGTFTYSAQATPNDLADMTAAFAPHANHVSTSSNGTYFLVESDGLTDDHMMQGITAWIGQFPTPQRFEGANAWQIPITPTYSDQDYTIVDHFRRQAIGLATNGIPIFNPYNASGELSAEIGELDPWGGHSGTADDYHYHAAPLHLESGSGGTIIAYMLDGFPVYGTKEPDGSAMEALDPVYHGHERDGSFHYHGTTDYPYLVNTFRGTVTSDDLSQAPYDQIVPQPSGINFRGNPYPMFKASLPHHIDSCIPNGAGNGYTLYVSYDGNNQKKCEYHWTLGTNEDTFYFNFYDTNGNLENSETYTRPR